MSPVEVGDAELLNSCLWTRVLSYQLEMLDLEASTLGFTKEQKHKMTSGVKEY